MKSQRLKGMFKCPVCNRLHPVSNADDIREVECTDNATSQIREVVRENPDILSQNNWNMNIADTMVDDYTNNLVLKDITFNNPHPRRIKNW